MAETSARILKLLSVLEARAQWGGSDLAERLGVSTRTLRRDVDTLRELGYPIEPVKGPGGGYRLGVGSKLPPLVLDDDQAVAIAVALQTAPATVAGIDEAVARALTTLRQVMPARLRSEVEAFSLTAVRNYWEFSAPPIDVATLRAVGAAVRNRHVLRFDYRRPDGVVPDPKDPAFVPPLRVEPHHLLMWAGRWYLVAFSLADQTWGIYRVERIKPRDPTGQAFTPRPLPDSDVARYVTTQPDRGDTPADWRCVGSAVLDLPATVVAKWAPGGSVVERVNDHQSRLTLGGWSWMGVAGLLTTFDADLSDLQPEHLRDAFAQLSQRLSRRSASGLKLPEVPVDVVEQLGG
jgi:predicted DNA-binding transcriptional regulator YafY